MGAKKIWTGIIAALLMTFLILDPKTALTGAKSGIEVCLATVVPSLFPFIILSGIITASFVGTNIAALQPIGRLCGIPAGGESLLLIGLVGGYPVGAQCIYRSYRDGQISKSDAQRMLGFCNNAGPAFIFGITAALFDSPAIAWIIWGIQILSALTVGVLLPNKSKRVCQVAAKNNQSLPASINQSVKTMGIICGWIVAAKILIGFLERWILWMLPLDFVVAIEGLLELSNGCLRLSDISSEPLRFILANGFLSAGGMCVWMQTISVTGELNIRPCFVGKALQAAFSVVASALISCFLFPGDQLSFKNIIFPIITAIVTAVFFIKFKKVVALGKKVLYNV